jgi:hypothetical protein
VDQVVVDQVVVAMDTSLNIMYITIRERNGN